MITIAVIIIFNIVFIFLIAVLVCSWLWTMCWVGSEIGFQKIKRFLSKSFTFPVHKPEWNLGSQNVNCIFLLRTMQWTVYNSVFLSWTTFDILSPQSIGHLWRRQAWRSLSLKTFLGIFLICKCRLFQSQFQDIFLEVFGSASVITEGWKNEEKIYPIRLVNYLYKGLKTT